MVEEPRHKIGEHLLTDAARSGDFVLSLLEHVVDHTLEHIHIVHPIARQRADARIHIARHGDVDDQRFARRGREGFEPFGRNDERIGRRGHDHDVGAGHRRKSFVPGHPLEIRAVVQEPLHPLVRSVRCSQPQVFRFSQRLDHHSSHLTRPHHEHALPVRRRRIGRALFQLSNGDGRRRAGYRRRANRHLRFIHDTLGRAESGMHQSMQHSAHTIFVDRYTIGVLNLAEYLPVSQHHRVQACRHFQDVHDGLFVLHHEGGIFRPGGAGQAADLRLDGFHVVFRAVQVTLRPVAGRENNILASLS